MLLVTACGPSVEEQAAMTATAKTATAASWTKTPTITHTTTPISTYTKRQHQLRHLHQHPQKGHPKRYHAPDGTISFAAIEGWEETESGLAYPALIGPTVDGFSLNLVFIQEESAFPMAFYSALVQGAIEESLQDLTQISEDFLYTDEDKDYFRWAVTNIQQGEKIHQVFYFFESGDWKLVITYSRLSNSGTEYDDLIDETMKTVKFKR